MKRMHKLFGLLAAALCTLVFFFGAEAAWAQAYDDLALACRYVRESIYHNRDNSSVTFALTSRAVHDRPEWEIRDILTDVLEACSDYDIRFDYENGDMNVAITYTLRPALKILDAWETGDRSFLTEDEKRCMDIALAAVHACRAQSASALELELALYEYVCAHVDYDGGPGIGSFGTEEYIRNSTCVGALLQGKTLCLGYAEVFYLLGRLAGLDVNMQYGFPNNSGNGKHAWNTIRIGEKTYVVDTCWGDTRADPFELSASCYGYFNLGTDLMPGGRHSHPEAEIAQISAQTDMSHTAFGYASGGVICANLEEAMDYAIECCGRGEAYAHVLIPGRRIELSEVDPLMWQELRRRDVDIKWERLTYDFAGGTYIIFRWIHEQAEAQ